MPKLPLSPLAPASLPGRKRNPIGSWNTGRVGNSCVRQPKATSEPSCRYPGGLPSPGPGFRPQSRQQRQAGGKFPLALCPGTLDGNCARLGGQKPGVQDTNRQPGSLRELVRGLSRSLQLNCPPLLRHRNCILLRWTDRWEEEDGEIRGCLNFSEVVSLSQEDYASSSHSPELSGPWDS